jgi:hypothetical protein
MGKLWRLALGLATALPAARALAEAWSAVQLELLSRSGGLGELWVHLPPCSTIAVAALSVVLALAYAAHAARSRALPPAGRAAWTALLLLSVAQVVTGPVLAVATAVIEQAMGWEIVDPATGRDPLIDALVASQSRKPLLPLLTLALSAIPLAYWHRAIWNQRPRAAAERAAPFQ